MHVCRGWQRPFMGLMPARNMCMCTILPGGWGATIYLHGVHHQRDFPFFWQKNSVHPHPPPRCPFLLLSSPQPLSCRPVLPTLNFSCKHHTQCTFDDASNTSHHTRTRGPSSAPPPAVRIVTSHHSRMRPSLTAHVYRAPHNR